MKTKNSRPTPATVSLVPERDRVTITMPVWVRDEACFYGAKRGYGMSELVSRLLEKFIEDEKARLAVIDEIAAKAQLAAKNKTGA